MTIPGDPMHAVNRKRRALQAYSPDQARDDKGQWTSGGGPGGSPQTAEHHKALTEAGFKHAGTVQKYGSIQHSYEKGDQRVLVTAPGKNLGKWGKQETSWAHYQKDSITPSGKGDSVSSLQEHIDDLKGKSE